VFDFDGTIADSLTETLEAYNEVAPSLDVPTITTERLRELRKLGPRKVLSELDIPLWKVPRIMTRVRGAMKARMDQLAPFPGMREALFELRSAGVSTAIVSSNSRDNIAGFLLRHGMPEFDLLSCGASLFGKTSHLKKLAKHASFAGRVMYYVGDEVRDIEAAREANARSVAVGWGYSDTAALEARGPDHFVRAPVELVRVIADGLAA
jgi:phosphoglycolate phosphatase